MKRLLTICCSVIFLASVLPQAAPALELGAAPSDVFPEATDFGSPEGDPQAIPAYRDGILIGYVISSQAVVASTGYSARPFDVLFGLGIDGRITGARLKSHSEPILAIGVTSEQLEDFVRQYDDLDINEAPTIRMTGPVGPDQLDGIAGATVSSTILNDAILSSARQVARSRGIIKSEGGIDFDTFAKTSWADLRNSGALVELDVRLSAVEGVFAKRGARLYPEGAGPSDPNTRYLDLTFGLASPEIVGGNIIKRRKFTAMKSALPALTNIIFVAGNGIYSFKGRSYRKTGLFERLQVVQGENTFRFAKSDHVRVDMIRAAGAPEMREAAFFTLPVGLGFDPSRPWRLDIMVSADREDGEKTFAVFSKTFTPSELYMKPEASAEDSPPLWVGIWQSRYMEVGILIVALTFLTGILVFQDWLVKDHRRYNAVRVAMLAFTLLWLGWMQEAQLSVLNVLTFADRLRVDFQWDFFLLEPLIFILWGYVAMTLLFWGRGVFCGWLCPFGALQELVGRLARLLKIPQIQIPFAVHERLWPLKYLIFLGLFALFLGDQDTAQAVAEVEPFKTAVVMNFDRAWPFVLYAVGLLVIALFVERFFCRYLCPLGAALALPAKLRMFEWLKRKWQCGLQCQLCSKGCPVQAIHPDGHINPNECINCLHCQSIFYDDTKCPPLVERRRKYKSTMTKRLIDRFQDAEKAGEGETK